MKGQGSALTSALGRQRLPECKITRRMNEWRWKKLDKKSCGAGTELFGPNCSYPGPPACPFPPFFVHQVTFLERFAFYPAAAIRTSPELPAVRSDCCVWCDSAGQQHTMNLRMMNNAKRKKNSAISVYSTLWQNSQTQKNDRQLRRNELNLTAKKCIQFHNLRRVGNQNHSQRLRKVQTQVGICSISTEKVYSLNLNKSDQFNWSSFRGKKNIWVSGASSATIQPIKVSKSSLFGHPNNNSCHRWVSHPITGQQPIVGFTHPAKIHQKDQQMLG